MTELHDAVITYIRTTGADITQHTMMLAGVSADDVDGCKRFYETYVRNGLVDKRGDHDEAVVQTTEISKHIWIHKFGSDQLRKAYDLGYPCVVGYLRERANHEGLRGYTIDFDNSMKTTPIDCPSVAAMAEIDRLAYRYKPWVVMLLSVRRLDNGFRTYPHREACVVMFMGYAFFKYVDEGLNRCNCLQMGIEQKRKVL